jgi:hypothetical protein
MAIGFDNASSVVSNAGAGGLSWSHTIGSGSNRILLVCFFFQEQESSPTALTVTYNSVAMTQVGQFNMGQYDDTLAMFILKEASMPTAGSYTVSVSFGATEYYAGGGAYSWDGVDQTTAAHNFQSGEGNTLTPTIDVTSATGEVAVDMMKGQTADTLTSNQTQRWDRWDASGTLAGHRGSSAAGAASVTMSYTFGTSAAGWKMIGASIKDAAGGGGGDGLMWL